MERKTDSDLGAAEAYIETLEGHILDLQYRIGMAMGQLLTSDYEQAISSLQRAWDAAESYLLTPNENDE